MRLKNIQDINAFMDAINSCEDDVFLTSQWGDKYNLKSSLSAYVAIAALIGEHGDELELWTQNRDDERIMLDFFAKHPEILN